MHLLARMFHAWLLAQICRTGLPPVGSGARSPTHGLRPGLSGLWLILLCFVTTSRADPIINEFVAANLHGLKDEDGEPQDWIELLNPDTNAVSLMGWSLTDDEHAPDRWVFPNLTLRPGEYVVVFASGKDRKSLTSRLHTNFKLNPTGSYLGLFNAEIPRRAMSEFRPGYPEQRNDYSYGRDDLGVWRYYASPTPGTRNGSSTIAGVVPPVHFSTAHGFFDQPFKLVLSVATAGTAIRFTTDGSEPTAQSGSLYAEPLSIKRTTIVRAAAFQMNMLPSIVGTRTYLFSEDVVHQPAQPPGFPLGNWGPFPPDYEMDPKVVNDPAYRSEIKEDLLAIPSLSIVCNVNDLFGAANGIYTHSSASFTGPAWTRPCSMELIFADGHKGTQTDCGIRMHGGGSREQSKEKKHSFRLLFKQEYGSTKLDYPFFPDSPVTEFDTLILRADYNNHWTHMFDNSQRSRGTLVRDAWFKDVQAAMGAKAPHSRYVHLYLNGLYWGVYNPMERPDASFAASYYGGTKEEYDAFNGTFAGTPVNGTTAARNAMLAINNLENQSQYNLIQQYLDVPQYIDYMILELYGANQDWGTAKNWYSFRRRQPGAGFKYICWDDERTLEGVNDLPPGVGSRAALNSVSPDGLQAKLAANAEYRLAFADRVHRHFFNGGAMTPEALTQSWQARAAQIDRAIVGESARWGDLWPKQSITPLPYPTYTLNTPYTRNADWLGEQGRLLTKYFPTRSAVVLDQFRAAGLYPPVVAPSFNQHGGRVPAGFGLTMNAPAGSIYYTTNGSDPRVPVSGAVADSARLYTSGQPLVLTRSVQVKSRALSNGVWSALNKAEFLVAEPRFPLRITEIMYDPAGGDVYEFLELYNSGSTSVDLTGMYWDGIDFVFPPGSVLAAGAAGVLIPNLNPMAFAARYPGVPVLGIYRGSLANNGERLRLVSPQGHTLISVTYASTPDWPPSAHGGGHSLEIVDAQGDLNDAANWRASTNLGGSPGVVAVPPRPAVCLNEIMAANSTSTNDTAGTPDWVELYNGSVQSVDMTGWSLMDDTKRPFIFPPGTTLAAGGYLVLWCDHQTNAPGLHTDFGLKQDGESLFLYDQQANCVDAISFGQQVPNYSVGRTRSSAADGRDGNGAIIDNPNWQLTIPTPGSANAHADVASPTNLVINEWLAKPAPGEDDWLELYNRDPHLPVALGGLYLSTSNACDQIRALAFVPPAGFVRLWADEKPGWNHLDFKLPAAGGVIVLEDPLQSIIDQVTYDVQTEGTSQGRLPDGSANVVAFAGSSSPGGPNYLPAYSGPRLNEIMAHNASATTNRLGQTPDWIEVFNPSPSGFDLAGMSLSVNNPKPGQWVFPSGTTLPAGAYLMIWCDDSRPSSANWEPELNTGQGLNGDSGGVYLFSRTGQLVDSVEYGFQVADMSIGLAGDHWQLDAAPTPGAPNSVAAALGSVNQLRINEWMALPLQGGDWFELYNLDSLPVALSGLYLTDDPSLAGRTNSTASPLSFIGPHSKVKWVADGSLKKGRDHLNFALDGQGDLVRLYDSSFAVIDEVYFATQTSGVSEGRSPDGGPNIGPAGFAPTIAESPHSITVLAGSDLILTVTASGTAPLEYRWRFQGTKLPGALDNHLVLAGISLAESGIYDVLVANRYGNATSAPAVIQVEAPPRLELLPPQGSALHVLRLTASSGSNFMLESSTNLMDWIPVATNQLSNDRIDFVVPSLLDYPWRFYRAKQTP